MALYPYGSIELLPQNASYRPLKPRSIILHTTQAGHSSPRSYFANANAARGVESHFWLDIDGGVHQFMDTEHVADCQFDGNQYGISIESADNGARNTSDLSGYTPAQLVGLNRLLVWLCRTHGIPAVQCPSYDGRGIGYHKLFSGPPGWNWYGGHDCPGGRKIAQIPGIIGGVKSALTGGPGPVRPKPPVQPPAALPKMWLSLFLQSRKLDQGSPANVRHHGLTVITAQRSLMDFGFAIGPPPNGHFGWSTWMNCKAFQKAVSGTSNPDGILGPKEWAHLAAGPPGGHARFNPQLGNYLPFAN